MSEFNCEMNRVFQIQERHTNLFACVMVGSEQYLCTDGCIAVRQKYSVAIPNTDVQKVMRTVGSNVKLK